MKVIGHYLVDSGVKQLDCLKNRARMEGPEIIVVHYTAGRDALSSAVNLSRYDTGASAHLVIGRNGRVYQLVPFHIQAGHASQGSYQGRVNVNRFSVGIVLDNAGQLHREKGLFFSCFRQRYMPSEVYTDYSKGVISFWHRYTRVQMSRFMEVCELLMEKYPIGGVVKHSEITPRKIDPGKAFGELRLECGRLVLTPPSMDAYL